MLRKRGTLPCSPGIDRQRSHTGVFASALGVITGLTITVQGRGSRPEPAGMREAMMRYTTTRLLSNTCGAARPLAPMSSRVSCMSAASLRISGARGSATGAALRKSTGFPIFAMRSTATASSFFRTGVTVASSRILRRRLGAQVALHGARDVRAGAAGAGAGRLLEALLAQRALQVAAAAERALGRRVQRLLVRYAGGLAGRDRAAFERAVRGAAAVLAGPRGDGAPLLGERKAGAGKERNRGEIKRLHALSKQIRFPVPGLSLAA